VALRIVSCVPGDLRKLSVTVDEDGRDGEPVLWQVSAGPEGGPRLSSGRAVDVVVGTPPDGLVVDQDLANPLPDDQLIQVDVELNSTSFGFFFRPAEMEQGSYLVEGGDLLDDGEFEDLIVKPRYPCDRSASVGV
jgi:hypothetical protein